MKAFLLSSLVLFNTSAFSQQHVFSSSDSKITWEGTKVIGGGHQGTLDMKTGFIEFKDKKPVKAQVIVNMLSIKNTDLEDPKWNKKLVGHLNSDDFFSTSKHPEAKILVTSFQQKQKGHFDLNGTLTIKGISKPVQFSGQMIEKNNVVSTFTATLEIDRTEFNVRYGSGKFFEDLGDKMISDTIKIDVELKLKDPIQTAKR